jgi:DNA-binding transcriptional regulator YiaG
VKSDEFRALLGTLGLSQLAAARLMLVDARTVRRWISGEQKIPGPAVAFLRLIEASPAARKVALKSEAG